MSFGKAWFWFSTTLTLVYFIELVERTSSSD